MKPLLEEQKALQTWKNYRNLLLIDLKSRATLRKGILKGHPRGCPLFLQRFFFKCLHSVMCQENCFYFQVTDLIETCLVDFDITDRYRRKYIFFSHNEEVSHME